MKLNIASNGREREWGSRVKCLPPIRPFCVSLPSQKILLRSVITFFSPTCILWPPVFLLCPWALIFLFLCWDLGERRFWCSLKNTCPLRALYSILFLSSWFLVLDSTLGVLKKISSLDSLFHWICQFVASMLNPDLQHSYGTRGLGFSDGSSWQFFGFFFPRSFSLLSWFCSFVCCLVRWGMEIVTG